MIHDFVYITQSYPDASFIIFLLNCFFFNLKLRIEDVLLWSRFRKPIEANFVICDADYDYGLDLITSLKVVKNAPKILNFMNAGRQLL